MKNSSTQSCRRNGTTAKQVKTKKTKHEISHENIEVEVPLHCYINYNMLQSLLQLFIIQRAAVHLAVAE